MYSQNVLAAGAKKTAAEKLLYLIQIKSYVDDVASIVSDAAVISLILNVFTKMMKTNFIFSGKLYQNLVKIM